MVTNCDLVQAERAQCVKNVRDLGAHTDEHGPAALSQRLCCWVVQLLFILPHLAMWSIDRESLGSPLVLRLVAIDGWHVQRAHALHRSLVDHVGRSTVHRVAGARPATRPVRRQAAACAH
jgi:hypothetical protein